ncbi:MAG: MFS transporter [Thalassobaculales bacterium]
MTGNAVQHATNRPGASRRGIAAWCLYDWANSAYGTVIGTFVFAAYFTKAVAPDEVTGTFLWGQATALSGLIVAVAGPVMGAIADQTGRRLPWVFTLSALCAVATALLWFMRPDPAFTYATLALVLLATIGFELAIVFYNAMLPDLAPSGMIGRLSGWAWGLGYAGGIGCLVLSLALIQAEPPLFGLDPGSAEPVRATALLTAAWYVVFALPLFLLTPDTPAAGIAAGAAVRQGLAALKAGLGRVLRDRNLLCFLIASSLYLNGLNTLFAFGGIYAAAEFGMSFAEIVTFGIALNVTAGLGAVGFAWIDDWIGPKRTMLMALAALTGFGLMVLLVRDVAYFWVGALALGIFIGPAQAAGRTFLARAAPAQERGELFGLYALSGKATAFLGPLVLGWATLLSGSQRAGMATILLFFVAGLILMAQVREVRR